MFFCAVCLYALVVGHSVNDNSSFIQIMLMIARTRLWLQWTKKKQAYFIVHKIWHNTNELPLTMLIHGVAISSFIFAYIETVCARLFDRYFAIFDLLFSSQIDYVFEATISRVSIVN